MTHCDPLLGGIYEYRQTSKTNLESSEFEFHKKRSFLSEILQLSDFIHRQANPTKTELWFLPKYSVRTWSDWILNLPYFETQEPENNSNGFHRNEWNQMNKNLTFYQNQKLVNRWDIMDKVHFFTQKLFYQWKWNVRCAAFHDEHEAILGVIPLYNNHLIPFLFGHSIRGISVMNQYGIESVFHRVIRSLRREQFGLTLRAGKNELVIRYSDIRIREERGNSWDDLIIDFIRVIREQLHNQTFQDTRQIWMHSGPGSISGMVLEWWITWDEFWNIPSSQIYSNEPSIDTWTSEDET